MNIDEIGVFIGEKSNKCIFAFSFFSPGLLAVKMNG